MYALLASRQEGLYFVTRYSMNADSTSSPRLEYRHASCITDEGPLKENRWQDPVNLNVLTRLLRRRR